MTESRENKVHRLSEYDSDLPYPCRPQLSNTRALELAGHAMYGRTCVRGPYRPPGGVEEMQGDGRRVRLEWGAYITV
ncbi:hypothetical protein FHG87_017594 [Trinorchestia longiramus]|nr:hypothetical protein FHG87_017594 [Trinorchestia longiramus]